MLSKAEKAVFRRWYLHNNGAKTAIDDPAANSMPFVVPRVGIDINWNWLGPDDYFSSLPDTNEAVVAIIDTGVDFSNHKDGERYLWTNEGEVPNDGIDNDHNGYIDDIHGYNFCQSGKDVAYYQNSCEENNHGTLCAGIIARLKNATETLCFATLLEKKFSSLLHFSLLMRMGHMHLILHIP